MSMYCYCLYIIILSFFYVFSNILFLFIIIVNIDTMQREDIGEELNLVSKHVFLLNLLMLKYKIFK
jgi:hypothetical protein